MKNYLPIDLVGFGPNDLEHAVGQSIISINWPEDQSSECTWHLNIVWGDDRAWNIRGVSTMTESGHEFGSLRIEKLLESALADGFRRTILTFGDFILASCRTGSASEFGVTSDCAISLIDGVGRELMIATAPAPGAVVLAQSGQPCPRTEFAPSSFVWKPAGIRRD